MNFLFMVVKDDWLNELCLSCQLGFFLLYVSLQIKQFLETTVTENIKKYMVPIFAFKEKSPACSSDLKILIVQSYSFITKIISIYVCHINVYFMLVYSFIFLDHGFLWSLFTLWIIMWHVLLNSRKYKMIIFIHYILAVYIFKIISCFLKVQTYSIWNIFKYH